MRRSQLLVPVVVLVATLVRALPQPSYVGAPPTEAQPPAFGIAAPFGDDLKASSDAFLALQARSIDREGFAATGGIPLFNVGKAAPQDFAYYDHHPPGVAIVTALAFRLFGASELVARAVALLFATATLALLVAVVRRECGVLPALATAVAATLLPMGWYWSTHLDYQVPTIAMAALFMERALRDPATRRDRRIAALALVAALAFDFLASLAVVAVVVVRLATGDRSWRARVRTLLGWPSLGIATILALLVWKTAQIVRYGRVSGGLADHVAAVWTLPPGAGTLDLLARAGGHLLDLAGVVALAALAAALLLAASRKVPGPMERLLFATALFAALAGTLPRTRAWDHPYFQLDWQLPIALACGIVVHALGGAGRPARRWLAFLLIALPVALDGGLRERARARRSAAHPTDRPASHRLGLELARQPDAVRAIALPAASTFNQFVPDWYAGRVVLRLDPGPETRASLAPKLAFLGLQDAEVLLAKDPTWPGRAGFEPLR